MTKKTLISAVLALMSWTVMAQSGTINGYVKNSQGEILLFATITIENKQTGTQTDENGFYTIKSVNQGNCTLVAQFAGYTLSKNIIKVKADEIVIQNFTLEEAVQELSTVEIIAKKSNEYRIEQYSIKTAT